MNRVTMFLLGVIIGVLLGAACVVVGWRVGQATAIEPSWSAPVVFVPLPRLPPGPSVGSADQSPGARPAWRIASEPPGADQAGPAEPSATSTASGMGGATSLVSRDIRHGLASWYSAGAGLYGAAGPALRVGQWRGRIVEVCATGHTQCLEVRLVDWCACGDRPGGPTVIDLSRDAFARLAAPSRGLIQVVVSW